MNEQQRSVQNVPKIIIILLLLSLGGQIIWYYQLPPPDIKIKKLTTPPQSGLLDILSFGDKIVSAKILMLWLQAFDIQTGRFLPYQKLDYNKLQQWLEQILLLDPNNQYPLLAASHLYSSIEDSKKQRLMLEFVYRQFFIDPDKRWSWLAHVTVIAKHRLKDLSLALKYAQAISAHATPNMPRWAKEMQIFILEDMGELEQARLVVGGMLASGQLTDPKEIKFLNEKLLALEKVK
ncbi:hypothetical protein QUF74_09185 [Candidatus Halobeggiatoa sp. HSG11]|nr:hypothetical protein [Candidatus Halobeggiatoa sp. HSG11]